MAEKIINKINLAIEKRIADKRGLSLLRAIPGAGRFTVIKKIEEPEKTKNNKFKDSSFTLNE